MLKGSQYVEDKKGLSEKLRWVFFFEKFKIYFAKNLKEANIGV